MSRVHTPITDEMADYVRRITLREPPALRKLREETEDHPHAGLQTSPEQGQFLHVMARLAAARKTLEIGVFMGYSSTWVALALQPGGKVVACDRNPEYAARARQTWREAAVEDRIDLRIGTALDTVRGLLANGEAGSYDMVFIDADKTNYANYYECALQLVRRGGLIAIDNVLWHGAVIDPTDRDADTEAVRTFNLKLHADERIALTLATLGDGLTLACKL